VMAGRRDESKARARYLMGLLLTEECGYDPAEALLRSALDYMPELAEARVALGVVYCGLEREGEMLEEFRKAIRFDVRAVRAAVRDEPQGLDELRRILYPRQETSPAREQGRSPAIPAYLAYLEESAALVEFGLREMAAGRYGHAVELIERALRLDHTSNFVIAMLSLAYLLAREEGTKASAGGVESVLWEVLPELAEMLFKGGGVGDQSHNDGRV